MYVLAPDVCVRAPRVTLPREVLEVRVTLGTGAYGVVARAVVNGVAVALKELRARVDDGIDIIDTDVANDAPLTETFPFDDDDPSNTSASNATIAHSSASVLRAYEEFIREAQLMARVHIASSHLT